MIRKIIFLLSILLLSSCATLTLREKQNLLICSKVFGAKAQINDSTYLLPAEIEVKRSRKDLRISLITDSITQGFIVRPSLNPTFLYLNLIYPPYSYLVDLTNEKRFYYRDKIILTPNDSNRIILTPLAQKRQEFHLKETLSHKGQINVFISLPWVNNFYQQPMNETSKSNTGFCGISGGAEYYYKKNKYVSLSYSAVADLFIPFPAAVDYEGEHSFMTSSYLSLTDNFRKSRLSFGYGLNYSRTSWNLLNIEQPAIQSFTSSSKYTTTCAFGITLNSYYQFTRLFHLGLIYRPTLLNVYPQTEFKYQHLISLDFMWKFKIKK